MIDQAADIFADQIGPQRPGGIGVAEDGCEIGHVTEHDALVGQRTGHIDRSVVDDDLEPCDELQVQAGGADHQIGIELLARFQPDSGFIEGIDMLGDHRGLARADRLEQVAVGHQAKALFPRVVLRCEMLCHVEIGRQLLAHQREQTGLRFFGLPAADAEKPGAEGDVFHAHQRMDQLSGKKAREPVGERIFGRA